MAKIIRASVITVILYAFLSWTGVEIPTIVFLCFLSAVGLMTDGVKQSSHQTSQNT